MSRSEEFRELLVADLALMRGVAKARDVALALQRYWEERDGGDISISGELARLAGVSSEALQRVGQEADALIAGAGGDAGLALTRHGGLDRSIHAALSLTAPATSQAVVRGGVGVRTPLARVRPERYLDFEVAGEGGMGIVYEALDSELHRQVAFKIVRPPDPGDGAARTPPTPLGATPPRRDTPSSEAFEELRARFLQEAWVTGGLEHPGVVPVYELGETANGVPFYTMRFVRGQRTLAAALAEVRDAPIEERLALLEPFLRVCDTVRYAHDKGVLHRDLKPENVALGEYGEAILLDWGLAKVAGSEDRARSLWQEKIEEFRAVEDVQTLAGALGTPGYMAPEAALGHVDEIDARSDVYGLGAMLYEILTGHAPFRMRGPYAEFAARLASQRAETATSVEPSAPQALSDLCAQALACDKAERPADVATLTAAIRTWQAESAVEREMDEHLGRAKAALDAADDLKGDDVLRQVERAAGALAQVAARRPDHSMAARYRRRSEALRARGLEERDRGVRRRMLLRVGVAALVVISIAGVVVARVLESRREEADDARRVARVAEREALEERDAKGRALDDVLRLADSKRVRDLTAEKDNLWPLHPSRAEAMSAWLARARHVLENRSAHADALRDVRERTLPYAEADRERDVRANWVDIQARGRLEAVRADLAMLEAKKRELGDDPEGKGAIKPSHRDALIRERKDEIAAIEATAQRRRTWRFAADTDAWMHEVLSDLLAGLSKLADPGDPTRGLLPEIAERERVSRTLTRGSIEDHQPAWDETIAALADQEHNPVYGGLRIAPQVGLVPLGKDPASGLFEFAHVGSGSIPTRDPTTGRMLLDDDFAIVLVLLPGGTFLMGASRLDPKLPNYDPTADPSEGPVHKQVVGPFFLSKFECTQAQWQKLTGGARPSHYRPQMVVNDQTITDRHPVERVSYEECATWASRHRLVVPSEAQWEYACRAGTTTRWSSGEDLAKLGEIANIADAYCKSHGGPPPWLYTLEANDGWVAHAPVGSYRANALGLHDTHGNVWEWTRSAFRGYVDGRMIIPNAPNGVAPLVARGGCFAKPAGLARCSARGVGAPDRRINEIGWRPSQDLVEP